MAHDPCSRHAPSTSTLLLAAISQALQSRVRGCQCTGQARRAYPLNSLRLRRVLACALLNTHTLCAMLVSYLTSGLSLGITSKFNYAAMNSQCESDRTFALHRNTVPRGMQPESATLPLSLESAA
jgi:hypothetical protein